MHLESCALPEGVYLASFVMHALVLAWFVVPLSRRLVRLWRVSDEENVVPPPAFPIREKRRTVAGCLVFLSFFALAHLAVFIQGGMFSAALWLMVVADFGVFFCFRGVRFLLKLANSERNGVVQVLGTSASSRRAQAVLLSAATACANLLTVISVVTHVGMACIADDPARRDTYNLIFVAQLIGCCLVLAVFEVGYFVFSMGLSCRLEKSRPALNGAAAEQLGAVLTYLAEMRVKFASATLPSLFTILPIAVVYLVLGTVPFHWVFFLVSDMCNLTLAGNMVCSYVAPLSSLQVQDAAAAPGPARRATPGVGPSPQSMSFVSRGVGGGGGGVKDRGEALLGNDGASVPQLATSGMLVTVASSVPAPFAADEATTMAESGTHALARS